MKDISDKRVNISLDNPSITFDKNKFTKLFKFLSSF